MYNAISEAAQMAKATNPDVIFLNTPHGIKLVSNFSIYLNSKAKGNALWNRQWVEYDVEVDLDQELAKAFLQHLQSDGISAEGMCVVDSSLEAPLRWGEVVPLWFFRDMTAAGVKVVIFTNPLDWGQPLTLPTATKYGCSIAKFLNNLDQRVLYIATGDLAHSHKTDCMLPLYLPDPRWNMPVSKKALVFDLCIENWVRCTEYSEEDPMEPAKTTEKHSTVWDGTPGSSAEQWLSKAMNLKEVVVSCGIDGFGLLHGILSSELERKATYDAHLLSRLAPTYYGLAAAAFIKK
jgi:aromatic ring-opening dioxygenase LigB subunit